MSRIVNISGNFKKDGEWNNPDPYFTGEIILENTEVFYGYLNGPEETRYLVGVVTEDEDGVTDAQFYIMSNDYGVSPVFYNAQGEGGKLTGRWYEMKYHLNNKEPYTFLPKSVVKICFEKVSYSKKREHRIRKKFKNLKQNTAINGKIIRSVLEFF